MPICGAALFIHISQLTDLFGDVSVIVLKHTGVLKVGRGACTCTPLKSEFFAAVKTENFIKHKKT